MEKTEENVYGSERNAEKIATANREKETPQEVLTALGKFKDVDALAKAYTSLQAEFTRRSQRLKELEKAAENFNGESRGEDLGVEKLRKNAEARRRERKRFDEFVQGVQRQGENVLEDAEEIETVEGGEKKDVVGADLRPSSAENSYTQTPKDAPAVEERATGEKREEMLAGEPLTATEEEGLGDKQEKKAGEKASFVAKNESEILSSEGLYEQVCRDEAVRLKIIGEYLNSIGKTGAPLTTATSGALVTPPIKAKSIGDAGNMALRYFKDKK